MPHETQNVYLHALTSPQCGLKVMNEAEITMSINALENMGILWNHLRVYPLLQEHLMNQEDFQSKCSKENYKKIHNALINMGAPVQQEVFGTTASV